MEIKRQQALRRSGVCCRRRQARGQRHQQNGSPTVLHSASLPAAQLAPLGGGSKTSLSATGPSCTANRLDCHARKEDRASMSLKTTPLATLAWLLLSAVPAMTAAQDAPDGQPTPDQLDA